jgi:predicted MFS family arabinose efflux permease
VLGRALDESYPVEVRRHITLLTTARLCGNACYRFAPPFLATIARGLGVSLNSIGVALAIAELAGLLSPFTARIVDRLHRRTAMVCGLMAVGVGTTIAATSQGLVLFAIGLIVMSQSKVMFDLGLGSWIADHVPYERRSRVVGLTETSWAFGLLIGVSLMGLVTAATNWRIGYITGAIAVVIVGGIVLHSLPDDDHHRHTATRAAALITERSRMGSSGWLIVGGGLTLMAAVQCLFVTFGSWLEDSFDVTAAGISVVVFGLGLGELLASITSSRRTDAWGKERSTAMGALLMVPAATGLALWHDHLALGLAFLAVAICGFEFAVVSALAIGSQLVPGSPARGLALMIGGGTLGRAIASVPATRLYERSGIGWPATLCAILAMLTAVAMLSSRRMSSRRMSRTAAAYAA